MLPHYDAGAVAEVLGLVFRRGGESTPSSSARGIAEHRRAPGREGVATAPDDAGPPSAAMIEKAVENGLPRASLRHLAEWLVGGDAARVSALEQGVVPKTTLDRRAIRLSTRESERIERLARLFVQARRALGTETEARDFMTSPHPELDGRSPVDAAKTDLGTRRAEQILTALEYGLAL